MTEQEQYNADRNTEREVCKFLDEHLYKDNPNNFIATRTDDVKEQLAGIDLYLSSEQLNLDNVTVDEKCASSYWNKRINTFSFELSFLRNGQLRKGWLINDSLKTQYYNICWVNATQRWFKKEDITWLESCLIKKQDVLDYLATQNLTPEHLDMDDQWIRKHATQKGRIGEGKYDGCVFYFSPQLHERPINILIKKDKLIELAELHTEINVT